MKGRTASSIQRLKHSPDFTLFIEYLAEELELCKLTLVKAETDTILRQEQGIARWLTKLLKDIDESELIARNQH